VHEPTDAVERAILGLPIRTPISPVLMGVGIVDIVVPRD